MDGEQWRCNYQYYSRYVQRVSNYEVRYIHYTCIIAVLQIRVRTGKLLFLFLNQNISFGYPKHMYKLMGKEINAVLCAQTVLIWTYVIA